MPNVKNVVLLTIDALRYDHLSCLGYDREVSPAIDQFIADSIIFENAFSVSSHTREAIPSLITGKNPGEVVNNSYQLIEPTVAQYLGNSGFTTAAFHSNPFLSRAYGYGDDFDKFSDDMRIGQNKLVVLFQRALDKIRNRHYARADIINRKSLKFLESVNEPFFLWNHYMDVHGPYEPPEEYQQLFLDETIESKAAQRLYKRAIRDPESISETERQTLVDLYDAEIRYLDDHIRDFLERYKQHHSLESTLVIITADHGDAFGEHGYYEHPRQLNDELIRIPLFVRHPELGPDRIAPVVSTIDIVPTILDTTATTGPPLEGTSLLEIQANPDKYTDRVIFAQTRGESENANIVRFAARSLSEGCDLSRSLQSTEIESENLGNATRELVDQLRDYSLTQTKQRSESIDENEANDGSVNDAVEGRLRALGYRE